MTGLIGWRRSAALRNGTAATNAPEVLGETRSSRATWLAASAGAAAVGIVASASGWPMFSRIAGGAWAGFVLTSGVVARVTGLSLGHGEFLVHRAVLPDRAAPVPGVHRLVPPRTPFGAWRIATEEGTISLMPSDVLGAEPFLAALVGRAGLSFDGRQWHRRHKHV